jgi:acetyl-CoA carboxylase biotin carboxyl carrier protein
MIDIRKLKELVRLMVENDLTELNLQDKDETVQVKRGMNGVPAVSAAPAVVAAPVPAVAAPVSATVPSAAGVSAGGGGGAKGAADSEAGLVAVVSPMVGTFYAAPNPDTPAFVSVGSKVSAGTTVCLVEAMKVFNEIKAEQGGTIERILVQSGQAVEYGQKLFLVKP